jgi:hypothetical protein
VQFSLKRLFFAVTILAVLAAICRAVALRTALLPVVAIFAFLFAAFYREIKRLGLEQRSVVTQALMLIMLLVGISGIAVFLALLAAA